MGKKPAVISLFSGSLGLDLGLEQAGFEIRVAVETNRFAVNTIKKNRPKIPVIPKKIEDVPTADILKAAGLKAGEVAVVTAGPCCQAFSTAGLRESMADPRGVLFREFLRVVRETKPKFFVMENVRGVLSAAVSHRPLKERGPGYPPLAPSEQLGSAFLTILKELKATGYRVVFQVLNAADYGVPQTRERVIFIGSRDGCLVEMPKPTHSADGKKGTLPWVTLRQALRGLKDRKPKHPDLSAREKRFLRYVPAGGNWRDIPARLQEDALGGAFKSWGGRGGFYRRLDWNRPAPALTTRPDSKATLISHPRLLRPLSVREYARLQQFPDDWVFDGGLPQHYIQIGNAVPVGLGHAVGKAVKAALNRRGNKAKRGTVLCADPAFLQRLAARPVTILNPKRMRRVKSSERAKEWLNGSVRTREKILDMLGVKKEQKRRKRPAHIGQKSKRAAQTNGRLKRPATKASPSRRREASQRLRIAKARQLRRAA